MVLISIDRAEFTRTRDGKRVMETRVAVCMDWGQSEWC